MDYKTSKEIENIDWESCQSKYQEIINLRWRLELSIVVNCCRDFVFTCGWCPIKWAKVSRRKPGGSERKRKLRPHTARSTSEYTQTREFQNQRKTRGFQRLPNQLLTPLLLKPSGLKSRECTDVMGCRQNILPKPQNGEEKVVPPPPWDFVLARLELRLIPNKDGELKMSVKPAPVH